MLLGVKNNGAVQGVIEGCVHDIINNLVTSANNPNKLSPPFYLSAQELEIDGKKVIHVYVPESSQVHSTNGKVFDRNEDGDLDITHQPESVTQLYLRKQKTYSENTIYPYVGLDDFKPELFQRIRRMAANQRAGHPWLEMSDAQLMRSCGLYKKDHQTGKEGYTLAAVLLLGKDETIQSTLPHYKTDAILRVANTDRYDDRDDIRTNLIETYDRLTAFIRKHLPDKFHQEHGQRISLRDYIFREVIGNFLVHREYANAYPAKLVITRDAVTTENWNKPHNGGPIDPANFSPYPKNPLIARFFKEIGRVDELGSGVRNAYKYTNLYIPGKQPSFLEADIFTTQIPVQITTQITTQKILDLLKKEPHLNRRALSEALGNMTENGVKYHLEKLKKEKKIKRVGGTRGRWKVMKGN